MKNTSYFFSKYSIIEEDVPADTVLNTMIKRTEDEEFKPLVPVAYAGVSQDTERNYGLLDRVWRNFAEGAAPFPLNMNVPEAADRMELIADVIGQFAGIGVGLIPFALLTGTGAAAPLGVAGGAAKIGHARKAYAALKSASKLYNQSRKGGSGAEKALKLADKDYIRAQKWWKKAGVGELEVAGSGLLGKAPGYSEWLLKVGAEKSWVNALPIIKNASGAKIAKAVDLGVRNLGAFALYGQAKTPYSASLTERLQTLSSDAASASRACCRRGEVFRCSG